jgi:hypothetical protein
MLGWKIFAHAISMVWRNLYQALQIGLAPIIILTFAVVALAPMTGLEWGTVLQDEEIGEAIATGQLSLLAVSALIVVYLGVISWIFVAWHRYILLEEYPSGWIPAFRMDRIVAYVLAGLRFFCLIFVMAVGIGLLSLVTGGIALVLMLALAVIAYRFVAILPAAAVGQPLSLSGSWEATRGSTGAIIVMLILFAILQIALTSALGVATQLVPFIGVASQMTISLFLSLVNVSVMTTFYGHYVEKRELL